MKKIKLIELIPIILGITLTILLIIKKIKNDKN